MNFSQNGLIFDSSADIYATIFIAKLLKKKTHETNYRNFMRLFLAFHALIIMNINRIHCSGPTYTNRMLYSIHI